MLYSPRARLRPERPRPGHSRDLDDRAAQIRAHLLRDYPAIKGRYDTDAAFKAKVDGYTRPDANVLNSERWRRVQEAAAAAFRALDCQGLARVDFFLGADGVPVVNEVNTMPGFTPISMYPRVWAASGVDYPTLVDRLVQTALRRASR